MFVVRPTYTGEYLEKCSRCMVKTVDVGLGAIEMRWLIVIICPAKPLFANVLTLYTGISALSGQSGQRVV